MRILVAMSGGVDSSVVAHLLKAEGHDLVGVMMKLWSDPLAPEFSRALPTKCCSVEHVQRARSACNELGIPFYVLNLEAEFKREVVDPFLREYAEGKTPNPCIHCNRAIKFGTLLEKMRELKCEKLATGHYARTAEEHQSNGSVRHVLLEAIDKSKDQSYYLYTLTQEQLCCVLFPLGSRYKDEVLALAEDLGTLRLDSYRESQDLCFFPEKTPEEFLRRHLPSLKRGDIRTRDGSIVGTHRGVPLYTIGQRKGLGVGGLRIPLRVIHKDAATNTLTVEEEGKDLLSELRALHMHFVSWKPKEHEGTVFHARINSLGNRRSGVLILQRDSSATFHFDEPLRGIAPGQHLVLYRGEEIVGGGVITA